MNETAEACPEWQRPEHFDPFESSAQNRALQKLAQLAVMRLAGVIPRDPSRACFQLLRMDLGRRPSALEVRIFSFHWRQHAQHEVCRQYTEGPR